MAGDDDDVVGYNGSNSVEFKNGIDLLSRFYVESVPEIFLKTREVYSKLRPSFPYLRAQPKISSYNEDDQDRNLRQQVLTALAAAEVVQNALDAGEADREQNNQIDVSAVCADLLLNFKEKIKRRFAVTDLFQAVTGFVGALPATFPGSEILKLILEFDIGNPDQKIEAKRKVLLLYSGFQTVKNDFCTHFKDFESKSVLILNEEGLGVTSTFLNYKEFEKTIKIGEFSVQESLVQADKTWTETLQRLAEVVPPPVPGQQPPPIPQAVGEPEKDVLTIFKRKEESLKGYISRWENATDLCEQDCMTIRDRVSHRMEELEELSCNLDPGPETEVFDMSIELIRTMNKLLEELRSKEEDRRLTRQEEIRSLPKVQMPKLRTAADYISWRQSHQYILTTTSSFKKARLLLDSIEDKEVKTRCAGLIDPKEILNIVESMRARTSQMIPALLKNLRDMKPAHNMGDISRVTGLILNHFSQLQALGQGALSYLTATVIDELITKLPKDQQYEFEKFIDEKDLEADNLSECRFSTVGEPLDAYDLIRDASPLEIGKRDENYRIYFIKFIKKLEKQHLNVEARIKNNKGHSTEPSPRPSGSGSGRGHPKKGGVFAVDGKSSSCVVCDSTQGHKNQKGYFTKSLVACKKFRELKTNAERKKIILANKFCHMCLSPNCSADKCRITGDCHKCKKHRHNKWICTVKTNDSPSSPPKGDGGKEDAMAVDSQKCGCSTRLMVGNGRVKGTKQINEEVLFFDPGSTMNIILHKKAKELGYKGVPVTLDIRRAGLDYVKSQTMEYTVTMVTNEGEEVKITAFGMDSLTSNSKIPHSTILKMAKKFKISPYQLNNADGPSTILIGAKNMSLHPKLVKMKGELGLFKSQFGRPFWLAGNLGGGKSEDKQEAHFIDHLPTNSKDHFNQWARIDQLGLNTDPKCAICLKTPPCKSCSHLETPLSFKEQSEGELIKKSMTFDFEKKKVSARFPFLRDPAKVFPPEKSNRKIAEKMAMNLMKSLKKENKLHQYTECFAEQIERGVMRELSEEEMAAWERAGNPVNYCSHHPVEKASSSTPCRPVVNSSTYHNGTTLNEILAKGPTAISNLYHVLLRARSKPFMVIGDLRKAYHEIKMEGDTEIHLRRMVWIHPEDVDQENPRLRTYGLLCAAFGDRPSGFYLENSKMALQEWTSKQGDDWTAAKESLISNSYVDDYIPATDTLQEAMDLKERVPVIFSKLGFTFKSVRVVGVGVSQPADTEPETLVGYLYDAKDDTLRVNFKVNLSCRKRSMRQGEDLKEESQLDSIKWTKTNLASLVASQYDPLGLASVYLQQGRILVSSVAKKGYNWKDTLDEEDSKKVRKYAAGLLGLVKDPPVFPRAVCPEGFKLKKLVCFVDASSVSLHATLYGIFYGPLGAVHSSLLGGKGAIVHGTVPSNELFALLAGNRVISNYIYATEPDLEKICIISDSQASLDQLNDTFCAKDVLTRNKLRNIWKYHAKLKCPLEYYHCPSDEMTPADSGTRSDCPASYLKTPEYQNGPAFILKIEDCEFAVLNHTIPVDSTPVMLGDVLNVEVKENEPSVPSHPFLKMLSRVSRLPIAARIVCIVRSIFKNKSFRRPQMVYSQERLSSAFLDLVKVTQEEYPVDNLAVKQLLVYTDPESGVVFTSQRCPKDVMDNLFATQRLPVLAPRSRLAELALMFAHEEQILGRGAASHFGLKQSLVNSRSNQYACFVVQGKRAVKSLISRCVLCKKNNRVLQDALIAERKGGLGAPPPPDGSCFNKISMDYQGPLFCKLPKGRLTRNSKFYKQWLMIIVCQQTRAVSIVPCEGYHVEAFQTAFATHCAMHGVPAQVNSDPMSAFVSAAKELDSEINLSDYSSIFENLNIEWNFIPPGAQHRNGTCERIVRSVKQMLKFLSAHKDSPTLTAGELWLLSRSCSEILNRRPLSATVADGEVNIISPNDLILGRPSRHMMISQGDQVNLRERIKLVRDLTSRFWKRMQEELVASPHLFKAQKWNTSQRKPKKDDILLVVYKSKIQDDFRIGVVQEVLDERTVRVKVSPVQAGNLQPPKPCGTLVVPLQRTVYLYHEDDDNHLTDHRGL